MLSTKVQMFRLGLLLVKPFFLPWLLLKSNCGIICLTQKRADKAYRNHIVVRHGGSCYAVEYSTLQITLVYL